MTDKQAERLLRAAKRVLWLTRDAPCYPKPIVNQRAWEDLRAAIESIEGKREKT